MLTLTWTTAADSGDYEMTMRLACPAKTHDEAQAWLRAWLMDDTVTLVAIAK